jgi:hypothetical protein
MEVERKIGACARAPLLPVAFDAGLRCRCRRPLRHHQAAPHLSPAAASGVRAGREREAGRLDGSTGRTRGFWSQLQDDDAEAFAKYPHMKSATVNMNSTSIYYNYYFYYS